MVNTKTGLIILFAAENGEDLYCQQKQDWKLTVAQIMNSLLPNSDLKKIGKTTRPFKYDLNQIPYNYTVEVANSFKGLLLIEWLKKYERRFIALYRMQWSKPPTRKRNGKRQNDSLRRLYKELGKEEKWKAKEKRKYIHLNAEFQRIARRDKKAS